MADLSSKDQDLLLDLCWCIQEWQKDAYRNLTEDVLTFDWNRISESMKGKKHSMSAAECCKKWKYLAYGKVINSQNSSELPSDDDETYYQPLTAYKRYKHISDAVESSSDICLLQKQSNELPSAARVKLQSRRIKFLVPEQIPSGVSNLHIPVFSGEYAFDPVQKRYSDPVPLISTASQTSPHYKQYQEKDLFSRPSLRGGGGGVRVDSSSSSTSNVIKKNYYQANKERILANAAATATATSTAAAARGTTIAANAISAAAAARPATFVLPPRFVPATLIRPSTTASVITPAVAASSSTTGTAVSAVSSTLSSPPSVGFLSSSNVGSSGGQVGVSTNKRKAEEIIL